jgi:hypothetical protein
MPTQRQIERFTLVFHQEALRHLASNPALLDEALGVLDRWEQGGLSSGSAVYRAEWRRLLGSRNLADLARTVCVDNDHAATLRGMSPLGFVLPEEERQRLRRQVMAQ